MDEQATPARGPIETKVWAAAAGAGGGGVIAAAVLWFLAVTLWSAPADAAHSYTAPLAVPGPVRDLVLMLLAIAGAAIAGYMAPHTPRSDRAAYPGRQPMILESSPPLILSTGPADTQPAPVSQGGTEVQARFGLHYGGPVRNQ